MLPQGPVALVTGAARGVGSASARELAHRGARLALVGPEPDRLRAVAALCGPGASWHEADVTDAWELWAAVDDALGVHGRIDVVFANAAAALTTWATADALVATRGYLLLNASLPGTDALARRIRKELGPAGVAVGVAHLGRVDDDTHEVPVSAAATAIAQGIECRRARVVAPRWRSPATRSPRGRWRSV
jgi:hypothetical protein